MAAPEVKELKGVIGCAVGREENDVRGRALNIAKNNAAYEACGVTHDQVDSFSYVEGISYTKMNEYCVRIDASIVCKDGQKPGLHSPRHKKDL